MNWEHAAESAGLTGPSEVRAALPLLWAARRLGIDLEPVGGEDGRHVGLCPFHDDSRPSLDAYLTEDGVERWGCFPCGLNGDVLDLLRMVERLPSFPATLDRARELWAEWRGSGAPEERATRGEDKTPSELAAYARARWTAGLSAFASNLAGSKGWAFDPEHLRHWAVGEDGSALVVPHLARAGGTTGVKLRTYGSKWAVPGSRFPDLYGAWRDQGTAEVLLVEGESDAWSASWWLRDLPVDVLALPTGAHARPQGRWLEELQGRGVTVALDGDEAGREGAARWRRAVRTSRALELPDGEDVTSAGEAWLRGAMA